MSLWSSLIDYNLMYTSVLLSSIHIQAGVILDKSDGRYLSSMHYPLVLWTGVSSTDCKCQLVKSMYLLSANHQVCQCQLLLIIIA